MGRPYKCPYCGQSESVGKGVRKTKTMGDRRIRQCKACDRKFTPKNQKAGDDLPTQDAAAPAETASAPGEKPAEQSAAPVVAPVIAPPAADTQAIGGTSSDGKPA